MRPLLSWRIDELGSVLVLVDDSAQNIPAMNSEGAYGGCWDSIGHGSVQAEPAVRAVFVVVSDVGPKDTLKVPASEDESPVQTLVPERCVSSAPRKRSPEALGSVCG